MTTMTPFQTSGSAGVQHPEEGQRFPDRNGSRDRPRLGRRLRGSSVPVELAGIRNPSMAPLRAADEVLVQVQLRREVRQLG